MTHGDELNDSDRIRAHIFLGQLLGVSAVDQVYDISGKTVGRKDIYLLKFIVAFKGKNGVLGYVIRCFLTYH